MSGTARAGILRAAAPDVVIETTPRAWAEFVTTAVAERSFGGQVSIGGDPVAVETCRQIFLGR